MKEHKLQIGDHVETNIAGDRWSRHIVKAKTIEIIHELGGCNQYRPIETTGDELIDFGFKQLDKYTFVYKGLFIHKRKRGFIFNMGKRAIRMDYVHNVQHVFRVFTSGQELIYNHV